jgi:hypothetical protein
MTEIASYRCNPCQQPCTVVLPNSAILIRAAKSARLYPMFTGVELVQNHETELKRASDFE